MSDLHPETGLRYLMVLPRGRAYTDASACYTALSQRHRWIQRVHPTQLVRNFDHIRQDPRNFVVVWGLHELQVPSDRAAHVVRVYSEALDPERSNMLSRHVRWLKQTTDTLQTFDAVFGHTPWMRDELAQFGRPTYVLPVGWCPDAMGLPDPGSPRRHRYTFVGAKAGKRKWLCQAMAQSLAGSYHDASGKWGRQLLTQLNASSGYLYLSHSDVRSFSTFRIWQAVATSAALVAEAGRDCWPMTDDLYVNLPTLTPDNVDEEAKVLDQISDAELAATSSRLHDALRHMTVGTIVDQYLVPASAEIVS